MKLLIALSLIFLSSIALAQPIDKALLVSDMTSADMLIARAAGEKTGTPVLILENGTLTEDVAAELASLNIKTVILVGGPAVISNATEAELERSYTVIRLWGAERTGTSVEVARYFWVSASCAVLAEDTKDSEADTELQTDAVQLAAADSCPFFPVPKGKIPEEVVSLLNELGIKHATFVGAAPEFASKLPAMARKEITGDKDEREQAVLAEIKNRTNGTLRLIIVAAPHWKDVLGHAGHQGRHTIVRIVSSTDAVPRLTELIQNNNISDVRIAGNPALASDVAGQLESGGINVTKVSGERASEVAIKAARESWERWQQRRKEAFSDETKPQMKSVTKRHVIAMTNKLEADLNKLETNIDNTNATASALLKSRINRAQSQLGAIRDYINNDNLDTAKRRIALLQNDVRKIRWLYRMQLRIDFMSEVSEEEN